MKLYYIHTSRALLSANTPTDLLLTVTLCVSTDVFAFVSRVCVALYDIHVNAFIMKRKRALARALQHIMWLHVCIKLCALHNCLSHYVTNRLIQLTLFTHLIEK